VNEAAEICERIAAELKAAAANAPSVRAVRRRFSKEIAELGRGTVLALAAELRGHPPFGRFVAYELVQHHPPTMRSITCREVESLGAGLASWVDTDTFACYISGPAWREGQVGDAAIKRWARSSDRWWRRAALVSTVPLNVRAQGGRGDTQRTLAICKMLAGDRDDMVVKALSWALRALSQHDPDAVLGFVVDNGETLSARIIREVRNKLTTGVKNPQKRYS
jgi:3-methyladenine DNA glycosylase AlkD